MATVLPFRARSRQVRHRATAVGMGVGMGSLPGWGSFTGLLALCREKGWPLRCFPPEELALQPGEFTPSPFVKETTGVDNVCERAAVAASGGGRLLVKKTVLDGVTAAVAACPVPGHLGGHGGGDGVLAGVVFLYQVDVGGVSHQDVAGGQRRLGYALTPWGTIAKRLELAAEGDFVLCLYNPASKTRPDTLKKAADILLGACGRGTGPAAAPPPSRRTPRCAVPSQRPLGLVAPGGHQLAADHLGLAVAHKPAWGWPGRRPTFPAVSWRRISGRRRKNAGNFPATSSLPPGPRNCRRSARRWGSRGGCSPGCCPCRSRAAASFSGIPPAFPPSLVTRTEMENCSISARFSL